MAPRPLPEATVARLAVYLQVLADLSRRGVETISSDELARRAGVNSANVRKDLSYLGTLGTPGVGYPVEELTSTISAVLGTGQARAVVIVGVGNLGRALASYSGFRQRGFHIRALVDADPEKIGSVVAGLVVHAVTDLPAVVQRTGARIAIIATPAAAAQDVADALIRAGVVAILNFAPVRLQVPDDVVVRSVDLSTELQVLAFRAQALEQAAAERSGTS